MSEIVFVPAGFSDERVKQLGLQQAPLNNPGILKVRDIRFQPKKQTGREDYRPIHDIHWIVDVKAPEDFMFTKNKFLEVFDYDWRKQYDSEFYAWFPSTNEWSFAVAGDSAEEFRSLEVAVNLADVFQENEITEQRLESYTTELKRRLEKFGASFQVVPRETPKEACSRSAKLRKLQRELESEVIIVLKAKSWFNAHFKSLEFWNTLTDLGLRWGDGDLFHWENNNREIGDDHFFSVWTTTDPGYFLPEEVQNRRCKPADLVFGFSIPRSADPEKVLDMMFDAVEYCRTRLGGVLLDQYEDPFDKERCKRSIQQTIATMREHNLDLGQGITLRLF